MHRSRPTTIHPETRPDDYRESGSATKIHEDNTFRGTGFERCLCADTDMMINANVEGWDWSVLRTRNTTTTPSFPLRRVNTQGVCLAASFNFFLFPVDLVLFHVCYPVYFCSLPHISPIFCISLLRIGRIFRDRSPRRFSARVFIATRISCAKSWFSVFIMHLFD